MPQATEQAQNDKVEQLAANRLTIPQDAIARLLQRLVRHALTQLLLTRCGMWRAQLLAPESP